MCEQMSTHKHKHTHTHTHTCVSFPSLAGFVTETVFSSSEEKLFAMGLSLWLLEQTNNHFMLPL